MIFKFLLWLDIKILWAVTWGRSKPGETISSAAWSLRRDHKWQGNLLVPIIDFLFRRWEHSHCMKSWIKQKHLYKDQS
jgi:hypothetical protein